VGLRSVQYTQNSTNLHKRSRSATCFEAGNIRIHRVHSTLHLLIGPLEARDFKNCTLYNSRSNVYVSPNPKLRVHPTTCTHWVAGEQQALRLEVFLSMFFALRLLLTVVSQCIGCFLNIVISQSKPAQIHTIIVTNDKTQYGAADFRNLSKSS
jgi:hypothetical protein